MLGKLLEAQRYRMKALIAPRSQLSRSLADVVANLNPVLHGSGNYFRWANSSRKFAQFDRYVQGRLALFDSKNRVRCGRSWGKHHDAAWLRPLGAYRLGVNTIGEPCDRKGDTRFDGEQR